ncbi:sensor histidine kinase [Embleya sp. NPDC050154]|uniref:sensor histidine kinase n=1 Tax=Embleya sp. NPDC050154 TaxID=3363988 RepID=UPI0037BA4458
MYRPPPGSIPRALVFDVVLAMSVAALAGLLRALDSFENGGWQTPQNVPWWGVFIQVAAGAALIPRRRRPLGSAAIVFALSIGGPVLAGPFAAYALGAYAAHRPAKWLLAAGLAVTMCEPWRAQPGSDVFVEFLAIGTPLLLGMYLASRRSLLLALTERAERVEREQAERDRRARAEERRRLAGEMHDMITHRVSLMVLQAGALRTIAKQDDVRSAAEELRLTGCQALAELRELVAVLRAPDEPIPGPGAPAQPIAGSKAPDDPSSVGTPNGPDVSDLIADSRAAGVTIESTVTGVPAAGDAPAAARTVRRVVQEALTNVHKHAPGARVRVSIRHEPSGIGVTVANTEAARAPDVDLGTGGTGLLGLRERVELLGGRLRAGPDDTGGFVLDAFVPIPSVSLLPHRDLDEGAA